MQHLLGQISLALVVVCFVEKIQSVIMEQRIVVKWRETSKNHYWYFSFIWKSVWQWIFIICASFWVVEKVGNLIQSNRALTIHTIAGTVGIDKECVAQILHDNFNTEKKTRKNVPNLLERVIMCCESWFFTYDPETKHQYMHWKGPTSPKREWAN